MRWSIAMMAVIGVLVPDPARALTAADCSPYGVNAHIPDEATLDALVAAGLGWVRMDFNWYEIEPSKGEFQFGALDQAVNAARARGLFVFATLAYSPKWAVADATCDDGTANPCRTKPPADPADWEAFVLATVKHFKDRVHHWGMWNEPNLSMFFDGTLDEYVDRILVPGAQAVKWEDPGAFVLGPELAGVTDGSQWNGDKGNCVLGLCTFNGWELDLAQVLDKAGSSLDIVTHHFYKGNATRLMEAILDGEYDSLIGLVKTHSSLKEILEQHAPTKEVWLTEYGWETPAYGGYSGGGSVSEADQAAYHTAFLLARQQVVAGAWDASDQDPWTNLTRVFLYDARDSVVDGHLYAFGILRVDGSPKPAWQAIRDFIAANPPSCPPSPPSFKTLPLISLDQGTQAVKAVDLWDYTEDLDTPLENLSYSILDAGDPSAGVALEEGHYLSVVPDKAYFGFTQGRVQVSDGQFTAAADFGVSVKPVQPKTYQAVWMRPIVDGDLSEWGGVAQVSVSVEKNWVSLDAGVPAGPMDLSANMRMTWDESHLYFAFEVTDNTHWNSEPAATLWLGDSVQFALDLGNEQTVGEYDDLNDWEVGVALSGEDTLTFCFHAPSGADGCPVTAAVRRKGNKTSYEAAFSVDTAPPGPFGMTFLVNENDGAGREGFLEWTPGIGLAKDPSRFAQVSLVGGPPPDPGPVADEAAVDVPEVVSEVVEPAGEAQEPDQAAPDLSPAPDPGRDERAEVSDSVAAEDTPSIADPGAATAAAGGCGCNQSGGFPAGETLLFLGALWLVRVSRRRTGTVSAPLKVSVPDPVSGFRQPGSGVGGPGSGCSHATK